MPSHESTSSRSEKCSYLKSCNCQILKQPHLLITLSYPFDSKTGKQMIDSPFCCEETKGSYL